MVIYCKYHIYHNMYMYHKYHIYHNCLSVFDHFVGLGLEGLRSTNNIKINQ